MPQLNSWFIFFNFAFGILMAYACYRQAKKLGREPFIWCVLGFLFGIFPLLFLYFVKKKGQEASPAQKSTPPQLIPLSLPFDSPHWYYLDALHQSQGPMDFNKMKEAWQNKAIHGHSYVWYDKMSEWKKVDDVDALRSQLETIS